MDKLDRLLTKHLCESEHLYFTRHYFKSRMGTRFLVNWHHHLIADIVDDIIKGKRKNVVINVAPGGTKTELVVVNFIARGLALNPRARFLHLSGSDTLAVINSATARDIITSDEYQQFWPLQIAPDTKSKKRWNVLIDGQLGGGCYATSIGGQVTGFRAGHMAEGFQGAILLDDLLKPENAFSQPAIDEANRTLVTTIKSRKANPDTPIVLIMQRVSDSDPTAFIQNGNVGGEWDFVRIPAILDETYIAELPEKYRKMIQPSETVNGRVSYWPYKEPIQTLLEMEAGLGKDQKGQRMSRHVYSSQYDQRPKALGGNIIKGKNFVRYTVLPKIKWRKIIADTAQKTKERNDYSVFEEWGIGDDGKIYLLDLIREKWEAPELQRRAIALWAKAKNRDTERFGILRKLVIEDKASGTGLIQTLRLPPYNIPVEGLQRDRDKLSRVMDALPYIEIGAVCVPESAPFTLDFIAECESFSADDSHDHDDQVDCLVDAVADMLQAGNKMKQWEALAPKKIQEKTP